MKNFLIILLLFPMFLYAQDNNEAKDKINLVVDKIDSRYKKSHQNFVIKKRKQSEIINENWSYSIFQGKIEFFEIRYWMNQTQYLETFHVKDNQLIHAGEKEEYYAGDNPKSDFLTAWSAIYYFQNRKLVYFSTNGHGKSETDDWEPEKEALEMFDIRFKQLRAKLKINK